MPVYTKHKDYQKREADWTTLQALLDGESAIKAGGETFLPKLEGQTTKQYDEYKNRGTFFNAFFRTVTGLTGAALRVPPKVEADQVKEYLDDVTLTGKSFDEISKQAIQETLSFCGFGILVDFSEKENRPYFSIYRCTDIINWKYDNERGSRKLSLLVLKETYDEKVDDFEAATKDQIRVLQIIEGILVSSVYRFDSKEWVKKEDETASVRGRAMDEIPFVYFGEGTNLIYPGKPPLLDLANLNIKHWQVTVDYFHGLHYCAIPTPWAAGFPKESKLYVGGKKAWISEDPNAKCGFMEFTGQGLDAVVTAINNIEKQMAVMGARLLEEQKAGVEAAEAIELRQSGDLSSLSSLVGVVEQGMIRALGYMALWGGTKKYAPTVTMNRDFISSKLSAQELVALLQAVQAGQISQDTFLWNLQQGEVLPPDRSIKEEKDLIDSEAPKPNEGDDNIFPFQFGGGGQIPGQKPGQVPGQQPGQVPGQKGGQAGQGDQE